MVSKRLKKVKLWKKVVSGTISLSLLMSIFPLQNVRAYDVLPDRSAKAMKELVEKYQENIEDLSVGINPIKEGVDVSTYDYQAIIVEFKSLPRITSRILKGDTYDYSQIDNVEMEHNEFNKFLLKQSKEKSRDMYVVEHSYYDTFNGVAMNVRGIDIPMLLESEVVKSIWKDEDVRIDPSIKKSKSNINSSRMISSTPLIGVDKLREEGITGKGIKVGVIDTGIDYNHPDLKDNYKAGGYDFVDNDDDPMETTYNDWLNSGEPEKDDWGNSYYTSHGTHVSGTIGANGKNTESEFAVTGIAPEAELYGYRVLGPYGVGASSDIIAAIEQSVKDGMDVINLSLGITTPSPLYPSSIACNNAAIAGVVPVVANGNAGPGMGTLGSPGTSPLAISVGASTTNISIDKFKITMPNNEFIEGELIARTFDSMEDVVGNSYEIVYGGYGFEDELSELDVDGKVLFVDRGNIPFSDKFINAKSAGAVALIIANDVDGEIGLYFGEGTDRVIGIGISRDNGQILKEALGIDESISIKDNNKENLSDKSLENKSDELVEVNEDNVIYEETDKGDIQLESNKSIRIEFNGKSSTKADKLAEFSSRGPSSDETIRPDITAPGVGILSTYPEYINSPEEGIDYTTAYSRIDGTSMASPHVAGVVALMLQNNKELTPDQIKVLIMNTAEKLSEDYGVNAIGAGRINAYEAVHSSISIKVLDKCESLDENYEKVELDYITGSMSFDRISKSDKDSSKSLNLQISNQGESSKTFDVDVEFLGESVDAKNAEENNVTLDINDTVTVNSGEIVDVKATINVPSNSEVGRYEGFVIFRNTENYSEDYRLPFAVKYLTPGIDSIELSRPAMSNDLEMMHFAKVPGLSAKVNVSSPISSIEVYIKDYKTEDIIGLSGIVDTSHINPGYSDNIVALDSRGAYFPIDKDGNMDMVRSSLKDGKYILEFICNDGENDNKYKFSYSILVDNEDAEIILDKEPGVYEISKDMLTVEEYLGEEHEAYWLHGNVSDNSISNLVEMGYEVDPTSIKITGFVNGMPYYGIAVDNDGNFKIGIEESDIENGVLEVSPMPVDIATSQNLYMQPRYFFVKEGTPYHSVTLDKDEMSLGENINATIGINNTTGSTFNTKLNFFKAFEIVDVKINKQLREILDKNGYSVKLKKNITGYSTRELELNLDIVDKFDKPVNISGDIDLIDVELKLVYDSESEFYKEYIKCQRMNVNDKDGNPVEISYNGTYEGVKINLQTSTLKTFQLAEGFNSVGMRNLYTKELDKYIWIEDSNGNKYDLIYDPETDEYDCYNLPKTDEEMRLVSAMPGHFRKTAKFVPSRMVKGELLGKVYYLLGSEFYRSILGGDANGDGVIDILDALEVEKYYGKKVDYSKVAVDFNFDGIIDCYDMDYIVYNFGAYNEQVLERNEPEVSYEGRTLDNILEDIGYNDEIRLDEINIDETYLYLNVGEKSKINATVVPENVPGLSLLWTSENEKVATVDSNGNIEGVSPGSTRIIVKTSDNRLALSCYVDIGINGEVPEITDVTIDDEEREVYVGDEFKLKFNVEPYDTLVNSVEYVSSADSIVSVDNDGMAVAHQPGKVFISVNINGTSKVETWNINVIDKKEEIIQLESIKLNKNKLKLNKGEEEQLEVIFKPENATNKNVIWSSSDENIATVINGKIVAKEKGNVIIKVISEEGGYTDICKVTIKDKPSKPEKPNKPGKPSNPEKPSKPEKPSNPNLPQTGSVFGSDISMLLGMIAISTSVALKKRKIR